MHGAARSRRVGRTPHLHHLRVTREQGVGANEDKRAGEKADRCDPGTSLRIGLGRELERDAATRMPPPNEVMIAATRSGSWWPAATTAPASSEPPTTSPQPIEAPRLLM
jgi:hypothetical protein